MGFDMKEELQKAIELITQAMTAIRHEAAPLPAHRRLLEARTILDSIDKGSEPVAWMCDDAEGGRFFEQDSWKLDERRSHGFNPIPVYATPQSSAPQVPPQHWMQAKIDALMLEFCPDEMTPEQKQRWADAQVPASPSHSADQVKGDEPKFLVVAQGHGYSARIVTESQLDQAWLEAHFCPVESIDDEERADSLAALHDDDEWRKENGEKMSLSARYEDGGVYIYRITQGFQS